SDDFLSDNDGDDDDIEYFDDFGDSVVGDSQSNTNDYAKTQDTPGNSFSLLQDRLQQLQVTEQAQQRQIESNWKEGYWNVWGCSLDPYPPVTGQDDSSNEKTVVTCLRLASTSEEDVEDAALLIVGRSDGSLVWLKMDVTAPSMSEGSGNSSNEPSTVVTYFENKLSAKATEDGGMVLGSELQRSEGNPFDAEEQLAEDVPTAPTPPFDIVAQLSSPVEGAIVDILMLPEAGQLWTISQTTPNRIQVCDLALEDETGFLLPSTQQSFQQLETSHSSPIVAMKNIPGTNEVVTVSDNGQAVIWSADTDTGGSTRFQGHVLQDNEVDSDLILSMDVDDEYLYLGTSSVKTVVGFTSRQPGVTALCVAAPGTLNDSSTQNPSGRPPTKTLIAGSVLGGLKQWELIPTGRGGVEYWPRMASQRLPGKAHAFKTLNDEFADETCSIRQLLCIQKVILAATSSELRFWDPATGQSLYEMQGLDFARGTLGTLPQPSLVTASGSVLVTNGMEQYVCVHDFAMERVTEENAQDMIQRDDEE
ncbi:MAG: hypothetical protein SGARI_002118, partial [Bacillariaceae sp.]